MKRVTMFFLLLMSFVLMGNTGCDEQAGVVLNDAMNDPGKYLDVGKEIRDEVSDIDTSGSALEDVKEYTDTARNVINTVGTVVPGAGIYLKAAAGVMTLASGILSFMVAREKKRVRVVTEQSKKHEATANNYREGIEAGIQDGNDQSVVSVPVMKEVLDKETKTHFNSEGQSKL